MTEDQRTTTRIGFVDFGYAHGHRGTVPIECWAPNRVGELTVVADADFADFEVEDEWEDWIRPREDPSGLDILLECWSVNYDIIVSWNGLFGDYLPLARLSDDVAGILPKSVDLFRQLTLDVADVFPEKKRPSGGLRLGKVYESFGDEFGLGDKYPGDSALGDCWRIFSIYRKLLAGEPLHYEHVGYSGSMKVADDHAIIPASPRTLAAMRGGPAEQNEARSDLDWVDIAIPESVAALLDGLESWAQKPVLRFALQLLSPRVNERVRTQIRDGVALEKTDLERLRVALERTP